MYGIEQNTPRRTNSLPPDPVCRICNFARWQAHITGCAQINGYRGETDTLEKMKGRIDHDLEYLHNRSLRLDLNIIAKTVAVIFRSENAH